MHFFITGHTGFKGSWLTLWLTEAGHTVSGLALDPIPGALFDRLSLHEHLAHDIRGDVRDIGTVKDALEMVRPDAVIHMSAQPLVRESYRLPRLTMETNVFGTMNVLDAVAATDSVQAHLVVTTDKVYQNHGKLDGYTEFDHLGGEDPYSASKAMADILTQSWTSSFSSPPTAIARSGNVIGGGDICADRLLPDLIAAFRRRDAAAIRFPHAVRPWQHVLDCLQGYLLLVDHLLSGGGNGEWNFGPPPTATKSVAEVADLAALLWGEGASWFVSETKNARETTTLTLNANKAHQLLGWQQVLDLEEAVRWVVEWERASADSQLAKSTTLRQLYEFQGRIA